MSRPTRRRIPSSDRVGGEDRRDAGAQVCARRQGVPLSTHLPAPPAPARVAVLASGSGSLLQALLDEAGACGIEVVAVVSDRSGVAALDRARAAGTEPVVVKVSDHPDRAAWDAALADAVAAAEPDLVVSAGFMKVLGPAFLARFGGRTINTHPALLPAFPGAHGVRDALAYGVKVTGATVHLVDDGVDTGPVLAQEAVVVDPDDTEETLHERIKVVERRMLVETVAALVRHGATTTGRTVRIP